MSMRSRKVFCKRLLEVAGVTPDRLFLVPGNHDVDRSMIRRASKAWLYHLDSQDQIIELLGDPDLFPLLMRKFAAFNRFAGEVLKRELFSDRQYSFTETAVVDRGGKKLRIKVAGLNSALFAGYDGDDQRKLAYGLPQVEAAVRKSAQEPHLTIALSHHPFTCFHPADRVCHSILMQHADLILTGHLHEPENMFVRDAAGQAVLIGAGASFETRESHNSFNVVEIDLETGAGEVQFYKYLPDHHRWKARHRRQPRPRTRDLPVHYRAACACVWSGQCEQPERRTRDRRDGEGQIVRAAVCESVQTIPPAVCDPRSTTNRIPKSRQMCV